MFDEHNSTSEILERLLACGVDDKQGASDFALLEFGGRTWYWYQVRPSNSCLLYVQVTGEALATNVLKIMSMSCTDFSRNYFMDVAAYLLERAVILFGSF